MKTTIEINDFDNTQKPLAVILEELCFNLGDATVNGLYRGEGWQATVRDVRAPVAPYVVRAGPSSPEQAGHADLLPSNHPHRLIERSCGDGVWSVSCKCGWSHPKRGTLGEIKAFWDAHLDSVAVGPVAPPAAMPPEAHVLASAKTEGGSRWWHSQCSCGWTSIGAEEREGAVERWRQHVASVAPPPPAASADLRALFREWNDVAYTADERPELARLLAALVEALAPSGAGEPK